MDSAATSPCFFTDFITRWILPHHPELVVYSDPIGILKTGEDAFGKNAKQTLSKAQGMVGQHRPSMAAIT